VLGGSRGAPPAPPPSGDITTQLLERVSRLEDEVRTLRGRLDELANAQKQMNDDLSKQIEDLNFQLQNRQPAAPAATPAAKPAPVPLAPKAARTPEAALQEGNAALARRDYATAENAAREVIASKSPRAYDGQFLLGEALFGKRDFQGAAVAYDDAYNRAKKGARAQDSLLGLANALIAIDEKRAACATLDKLKAEFPTPRTELRQQISTARIRAGCP
jgi:TolA-binding protein